MNRIFQLTRRLWAALLALCLVLALTLPVFAEGESSADTTEKRLTTSVPWTSFYSWPTTAAWTAGARIVPSCWTLTWN